MLEILAPCGSPESLNAALNAGADAVYLGLSSFSARKNAVNFTFDDLKAGVKKAHRYGVKVYAAINTLVFDDEIKELEKTVIQAKEAEVNAVIVQDFGAAKIVKKLSRTQDARFHTEDRHFGKRSGICQKIRLYTNSSAERAVIGRNKKNNFTHRY